MARAQIDDGAVHRIITTAIEAALATDAHQLGGDQPREGVTAPVRIVSLAITPQPRHNQDLVVDTADFTLEIHCSVESLSTITTIYAISRLAAKVAKALDSKLLADSANTHRVQCNRVIRRIVDQAAQAGGGQAGAHSLPVAFLTTDGRIQRDAGDTLET